MACLGVSTTATKTYQAHKRRPPPVFKKPIPGTAPGTLGFPLRTGPGRLTGAHPTAIPPNPFSAPPPRPRTPKREGLAGRGRSGGGAERAPGPSASLSNGMHAMRIRCPSHRNSPTFSRCTYPLGVSTGTATWSRNSAPDPMRRFTRLRPSSLGPPFSQPARPVGPQ